MMFKNWIGKFLRNYLFDRVLFDVLEKATKKTSQKDIIPNLYRGTLVSKVVCQKCGYIFFKI